jgi:hypothetical protein
MRINLHQGTCYEKGCHEAHPFRNQNPKPQRVFLVMCSTFVPLDHTRATCHSDTISIQTKPFNHTAMINIQKSNVNTHVIYVRGK